MSNRVVKAFVLGLILTVVALADTSGPFLCNPFPVAFAGGTGGPSPVQCPAFSVLGGTLTGVTLTYFADYQFGNDPGPNTVRVTFDPQGPAGVTWPPDPTLIVSGGPSSPIPLPSDTANAVSGVSNAAFSSPFVINVSSVVTQGAVATSSGAVMVTYTFTPPPPVTLTCPANTGTVGIPYSSALVATGGVPPYTFSIVPGGSLPPGLTLNPNTGAITGTPTAGGPFDFTARVVDLTGSPAGTKTADCRITVTVPPPITLTCPVNMGIVGVAYTGALVAGGGVPPYTFSITAGSLPGGLTLNPATGAITGTPTGAVAASFTARVVDVTGTAAGTTTVDCNVTIVNALGLTCPAVTGRVGVPYSSALVATGGFPPYVFSISSGNLPGGLNLDANTGAITGTPTAAGVFNFNARVVDSVGGVAGTVTISCSINIGDTMTLTCPASVGTIGVPYTSALVAGGGFPPFTYSITAGSLPGGLTLNPATGAITGTPNTAGSFPFSAQVVDSTGTAAGTTAVNCTIAVSAAISLTCPASTGMVGSAYSSFLVASGGFPPYTFSIIAGSLPPPLTLNPATGAITGTPTTAGPFAFTAQVVDSTGTAAGTATVNCTIAIASPPIPPPICPGSAANIDFPTQGPLPENAFLIRYAANLNVGDSLINITNTGLNGAPLQGPGFGNVGNICVNVYGFSPDEQLVSCCSCPVTPNALTSLSVKDDIFSNTLTGATPNSGVIKMVASLPGTSTLTGGMAAWGTTTHVPGAAAVPGAPAPFAITETPFVPGTLSAAELASITNRCRQIIGNGSGFGICRSCQIGGRGADKF